MEKHTYTKTLHTFYKSSAGLIKMESVDKYHKINKK